MTERLRFAKERIVLKSHEWQDTLVSIGDRCRIRNSVKFHGDVRIGDDCEIHENAVIGESGFGFEKDENGVPFEIVHTGGVVIGNRVRIGANVVISRGTLHDTIIGDDCKIDDLIHIAHNVKIGARTMMASGGVIGGSAQIGEDVWIGTGVHIKNKVTVADRAYVGVGAVVIKDVPLGMVVVGNPARVIRERRENE